ncbi:hypothetical protein BDV96DRAFT_86702 [Lophiotrema nucula]|uniref:Fungal N-terminal domain-containing protein n=1 Tax=Lophiotrema nucula TaxID=690887 RepID=A0A6A5Z756_9PLEO|nr:hypothetical protein BDV96DRAFT_86702 [Lophiotrema nucula]
MTALPSIGDILMLSQLAWKIGRAFTAGRKEAPSEFHEVETEINGLAKALKLLAEAMFAEADNSLLKQAEQETRHGVGTILLSCQRTVKELDSLMDQYQVIKKHRTAGGFAIERSWSNLVLAEYQTMTWTADGGNIQSLRDILQMHKSTITLMMQALQSKSPAELESVVGPVARKIDHLHDNNGTLVEHLDDIHSVVADIARQTSQFSPTRDINSRPPSSIQYNMSPQTSPGPEAFRARDYFPPRQSSKRSPPPPSSPSESVTVVPTSPTASVMSTSPSTTARKRISEFSVGPGSRYSNSYAGSDPGNSSGWPSPSPNRNSHLSRHSSKRESRLPRTPEMREPDSRPDSTVLPALPPPAMDIEHETGFEKAMSISKLSLHPPVQPEIVKLHRSSTTASQKSMFEKQAFRNAAILCDVRGSLVEYTHKVSENNDDVEMVQACEDCRIAVVRKREPDGGKVRMMTSVWVFSDNNTVRMELKMEDGEMYVPYSSYFTPEKISVTVPCELKYHDVQYGIRPSKIARTRWINYVFDDPKGAILFQNELMGRTLLGTFRTEKTLRIHEGLSGAFAYQEQMCGMENLRIWEDDTLGAVICMIHFSAHFKTGYLAFYLNSLNAHIRVKDEGGREVKVKGLKVPLEKGALRKDSVAGGGKELDKKKIISGARIEFASEVEKREFIALVKNVQSDMRELPDLMGVN